MTAGMHDGLKSQKRRDLFISLIRLRGNFDALTECVMRDRELPPPLSPREWLRHIGKPERKSWIRPLKRAGELSDLGYANDEIVRILKLPSNATVRKVLPDWIEHRKREMARIEEIARMKDTCDRVGEQEAACQSPANDR